MALDSIRLESVIYAELTVKMKEKLDEYMPLPEGDLNEPANDHRINFVEAMTQAIAAVLSTEVVKEIVENLEVNGVTVEIPSGGPITQVTPPQGGAVALAAPVTVTQNNDGTGRVA